MVRLSIVKEDVICPLWPAASIAEAGFARIQVKYMRGMDLSSVSDAV
jgi:hypothetical protein